jgi:hypothetical protein
MTDKNTCFICGENRPNSIEQHHIVPRRFGGSDQDENLVGLCASCHAAIEKLYDKRFYDKLGVESDSGELVECELDGCTATDTKEIGKASAVALRVCDDHREKCGFSVGIYMSDCANTATHVVQSWYSHKVRLRCGNHAVCGASDCKSSKIYHDPKSTLPYRRCVHHFDTSDEAENKRRDGPVVKND